MERMLNPKGFARHFAAAGLMAGLLLSSCKLPSSQVETSDSASSLTVSKEGTARTVYRKQWIKRALASQLKTDGETIPLAEYEGEISRKGNRSWIRFESLSPSQLKALFKKKVVLEIEFKSKQALRTSSIALGFHGISVWTHTRDLKHASRWLPPSGTQAARLQIQLNKLNLSNTKRLTQFILKLNHPSNTLTFWVRSPSSLISARLLILKNQTETAGLPVTTIDQVKPSDAKSNTRSLQVAFSCAKEMDRFECAFNGSRFEPCKSPMVYNNLSNGKHRFLVRAVSLNGQSGPAVTHSYTVVGTPATQVKISSIEPENSPTQATQIQFTFETERIQQTTCQLDDGKAELCTSPIRYSNLSDGVHTFLLTGYPKKIKVPKKTLKERLTCLIKQLQGKRCPKSKRPASDPIPVTHTWVVDRTAPEIAFSITPEELTQSTEASFSFQASEPATFECQWNEGDSLPCVSPFELHSLEEGTHRLTIRAKDAAGNTSTPVSYSWRIDHTAPQVRILGSTPSGNTINISELTLFFDASEPGVLYCEVDGTGEIPCHSPFTARELSEGLHEILIRATDTAGNESTTPYSFTVDSTHPLLTLNLLSPLSIPTQATSASVEFISNEEASVECLFDGEPLSPCQSPLELTDLSEGTHTLIATPTDAAGNRGEPAALSWEMDRTAPTLSFANISPPDSITNSTSLVLEFSTSEPSVTTCNLNSLGALPCASPYTVNGLSDGSHSVILQSTDAAGNISEPLTYSWAVSTINTARIVTVSPSSAPALQRSMVFTFVTDQPLGAVCALNQSGFSPCTSPMTYNDLPDGDYIFEVLALNANGTFGQGDQYAWHLDATLPTVTLASTLPAHSPTASTSIVASFSADEESTFSCQLDNQAAVPCTSPHVFSNLSDGGHTFFVTATDIAGNLSSPESYSWTVNTAPMTISNVSVGQITRTSAVITWTTSLLSSSQVLYGMGSPTGNSPMDNTLVTNHSVTLTQLNPFTLYSFQVYSVDRDDRGVFTSTFNFRTLR